MGLIVNSVKIQSGQYQNMHLNQVEEISNNSKKIRPEPLEGREPVSAIRKLPNPPTSDDCIKVYCRIRPLQENEELNNGISIVEGEHTMVLTNDDCTRPISKKYTFTELFKDQPQLLVIQKLCDPVLDAIRHTNKGGLIFAYGVTSSGKTHTVLGSKEEPGILQYLFAKLAKPFRLTPVEVYNDEFYALTTPRNRIHLIESSGVLEFKDFEGIVVDKSNMDSILQQIKNNRVQRSTNFNSKSSRSHAIFRIVTQQGKVLGVVDLAGSERTREGCSMDETTSINRSLLSLGRCIKCLRQLRHNKNIQIPFRQSRLTMALAEYFHPDFKLVMVVNINPSKIMVNETINVLEYAALARDIKPTTPAMSRYKNMSSSKRKMFLTLEETKSQDFDAGNYGKPSLTYSLKKCLSQKEEVDQPDEKYKELREFIIKMSLAEMRKNYFMKHQEVNKAFDFLYDREMEKHRQEIEQKLDRLKDKSIYTARSASYPEVVSTCVNTVPLPNPHLESSFKRKTYQQIQQQLQEKAEIQRQVFEQRLKENLGQEIINCKEFYQNRLESQRKKRQALEEAAQELHELVMKRQQEIGEAMRKQNNKVDELEKRQKEIQEEARALVEFEARKRQEAEELADKIMYEKVQIQVSKKIELDDLKRQLRTLQQKNRQQQQGSFFVQTGTNIEQTSSKKNNLVSTLTSPFKFIKDSARSLKNSIGEMWGRLSPSKPQLASESQPVTEPQLKPRVTDENKQDPNIPNIIEITEDKAEFEDSVERKDMIQKLEEIELPVQNNHRQQSKDMKKNKKKGKNKRNNSRPARQTSKSIDQTTNEQDDQKQHHKKRKGNFKSVVVQPIPDRTPLKDRLRGRTKDK